MANRTKLVAGNWKMNGLRAEGVALAGELAALGMPEDDVCAAGIG